MNKPLVLRIDLYLAILFIIFLTWHPFYLHQKINLFELGLYLPGISAVIDGHIPYRDFFYLRGPMDLYFPAFLMKVFGTNVAVLSTYFYAGTVITLCVAAMIAREIIPSRILFYTLIPVLVTRTFPRVVFTYWGGMRYAWGLLAIWCVIRFLRHPHRGWMIAAAALTVVAGLTSVEIGISLAVAISGILVWFRRQALMGFWLVVFACLMPFNFYFAMTGSWADYMNTQMVVVKEMVHTFPQTEPVPSNLGQVLHALFVPTDKNFRQMTPVFCYLLFIGYLVWRWRKGRLDWIDRAAGVVAVYGFMVYVTGFRNLWANVFEMSLQPQKIVMFYLLARAIEFCQQQYKKFVWILVAAVVISSLAFSIGRISKRFLFFRKDPLKGQEAVVQDLPRLKGFVIPQEQSQDISKINDFIAKNVQDGEPVLMYPELGAMHFIVDRPWVGRFATPTLAWISQDWHDQWMAAVKARSPKYAIILKQVPDYFNTCYFKVDANQRYFNETMGFIGERYDRIDQTPNYWILKRKGI